MINKKYIPICITCGIEGTLSLKYDAYFCPKCTTWLEIKCGDSKCSFCNNRPTTPMGENSIKHKIMRAHRKLPEEKIR